MALDAAFVNNNDKKFKNNRFRVQIIWSKKRQKNQEIIFTVNNINLLEHFHFLLIEKLKLYF